MAQSVQINGLDSLEESLKSLLEDAPDLRREVHERLAVQMLKEVRESLRQKSKTFTGEAASWQESQVGSGGGYAAVRPKKGKDARGYAFGYLTNALENGHQIRKPSGKWKHYKARIKYRFVVGLGFYKQSKSKIEKTAIDEANRLADEIANRLIQGG